MPKFGYIKLLPNNYDLNECLKYAHKHHYVKSIAFLQNKIDLILPDVRVVQ